MVCCRICIDEMKKPVSLPCGHIFCSECIVKTVQAAKPYTHLRPCPICRSVYNIAPINLNVVPPNLRPFVTPSIRRVYLNSQTAEEASVDAKDTQAASGSSPASESELARLKEENDALRNQCAMWRKRAEMHGSANLGLINFVKAVRDQASCLARERAELQKRCETLKRKIEDDETIMYSNESIDDFFPKALSDTQVQPSPRHPDPDSILFAPPFQSLARPIESGRLHMPQGTGSSDPLISEVFSESNRPRKRSRPDVDSFFSMVVPSRIADADISSA